MFAFLSADNPTKPFRKTKLNTHTYCHTNWVLTMANRWLRSTPIQSTIEQLSRLVPLVIA